MKDVNKFVFFNHGRPCFNQCNGGKMKTTVCGGRENKWDNGLEVPFNYLLKGPDKYLEKAECTIKDIAGREKII